MNWFDKIINLDHVVEIRWELEMPGRGFIMENIMQCTLVLSNKTERILRKELAQKLFFVLPDTYYTLP